jgi:hypothetical protein
MVKKFLGIGHIADIIISVSHQLCPDFGIWLAQASDDHPVYSDSVCLSGKSVFVLLSSRVISGQFSGKFRSLSEYYSVFSADLGSECAQRFIESAALAAFFDPDSYIIHHALAIMVDFKNKG